MEQDYQDAKPHPFGGVFAYLILSSLVMRLSWRFFMLVIPYLAHILAELFILNQAIKRTLRQGVGRRMNEKISSSLSYWWNGFIGVLGGISTDWWMVIIAAAGMIITAIINNYWHKKRFKAEFGDEQI